MIPVSKLNGEFLAAQLGLTVDAIKSSCGPVLALICDNRTNQSLFRKIIPTVENKPWLSKDNYFLLFDYVYLVKSIRNNWLTEKTGELVFEHYGDLQIAKWEHLWQLQAAEAAQPLLRLSKLTEKSVTPKHTEKQSVPLCLQVFCGETATALLTHSSTKDIEGIDETANFIKKVMQFWKICIVKIKYQDVAANDPFKGVIEDASDPKLAYLLEFGEMSLKMKGRPKLRMKQLSRDTSLAIHQTCCGLVELAQHLLATHSYVCLGKFSSDALEKVFGKLRQGSGGTYFISVQQVLEKLNIQKTSLLLGLGDTNELPGD